MIRCPHCQAKANLSKVIVSSKKKPYMCPNCGEFAELPKWQGVTLILIAGAGLAAQFGGKLFDGFIGLGSGSAFFLSSFFVA